MLSSVLQFTVSAYPFGIFKLFSLTLFPPMIIPLYSIQLHVISGHMAVYGPVHILSYDPQCHELFAIYVTFCHIVAVGVMFCRSLFLLFLLVIVSSVLQFTVSAYPFGIFKLFSLTLFPPMIIPLYSIQLYVITFVSIAFSSTNNTMAVYGPVHILSYDPQCHELFAIYVTFCHIVAVGIILRLYVWGV
jgi:hypothetical protein